jgi:hypothetical protein
MAEGGRLRCASPKLFERILIDILQQVILHGVNNLRHVEELLLP